MEKNKTLFEWVKIPLEYDQGWGLPRYVDGQPAIFTYEKDWITNFNWSLSQARVTAFLDQIGKLNLYNIK